MIEHRPEIPKVKDVFPVVNGLFAHINYPFNDIITNADLDDILVANLGLKSISPIVSHVLDGKRQLNDADLTRLARMILGQYKYKWDKDMAVMEAEYDPLHNYLDEYQEHRDEVRDEDRIETKNLTTGDNESGTSSNTRTDNLSESNTYSDSSSGSSNGHNDRYGLNSSEATGVTTDGESNSSQSSGTSTRGNTGTQSNSGTTSNNRTITETGTDSHEFDANNDYDKEGYHRGNIGNISTQKLIKEELELWRWNIIDEVIGDVKEFCTLPLYIQ